MREQRADPEGRNEGRPTRRVGLFLSFVLLAAFPIVGSGCGGESAKAPDEMDAVDTTWLVYQEGTGPTVLELSASILKSASDAYKGTTDKDVRASILNAVNELHDCMAGPHTKNGNPKDGYKALQTAESRAASAASKKDWDAVDASDALMHGHS